MSKAIRGIGKAIGKIAKGIGKGLKRLAKSTLGKVVPVSYTHLSRISHTSELVVVVSSSSPSLP